MSIKEEELMAGFLVLLIGKLTGWNAPLGDGGDPVYMNAEQTSALAAEGINLLASYLPREAAQKVRAAVERPARRSQATIEERLLTVGSLGGVAPSIRHGEGAPGCCVQIGGHLVCVRLAA